MFKPGEVIPENIAKSFYLAHVVPILDQLINGQYSLQEIQRLFKRKETIILSRYQTKTISLNFCCKVEPSISSGRTAAMACFGQQGQVRVNFSVPSLMREFKQITALPQGNALWEANIVIGFMHELDHLSLGLVGSANSSPNDLIEDEIRTWAETCRNALRLMIDTYQKIVPSSYSLIYSAWNQGVGYEQGAVWTTFIKDLYKQTLEDLHRIREQR